jgi:hypothetical protein
MWPLDFPAVLLNSLGLWILFSHFCLGIWVCLAWYRWCEWRFSAGINVIRRSR